MELITQIFDSLPAFLQILIAFAGALVAVFRTLRFVHEAEQGVRLRFGLVVRDRNKQPIIIEPGFVFIIPFIENLKKLHTREQPLTLEDQQIILKDKSVFNVGAAVFFRIHDVYKALFDIEDVDTALKNYCMGVLRDTLQEVENADGILDTAALSAKIFEAVKEQAQKWGLELTSFKIMNCSPTAETASFLNAGAAVSARQKALTDANVTDPQMAAALLGAQTVNTISSTAE